MATLHAIGWNIQEVKDKEGWDRVEALLSDWIVSLGGAGFVVFLTPTGAGFCDTFRKKIVHCCDLMNECIHYTLIH